MKISPLAQGTGVPGASDVGTPGRSSSPERINRAKSIAAGQEPQAPETPTGDAQADRTQKALKKIKMKTQVSPDRSIEGVELVTEAPAPAQEAAQSPEIPISPNSEPEAQEPEERKPLSPQIAALMKEKRALQIERAKLEKEKAELAQKSSFNPDEYVSKADLKANPLKVFEAGISYDDLTQAIINNPNSSPQFDAKALREELKKELKEEFLSEFTNRDQQAEKQILSELKRDVTTLTAQGEEYEAIRQAHAQQDVVNLVHRVWQKGWPEMGYEPGHIMEISEAANFVEEQLIEEALPFAKIKKVQAKLTPQQEALVQAATELAPPKAQTKVMRTITNRDGARPVTDRRSRAMAAFWNNKKD